MGESSIKGGLAGSPTSRGAPRGMAVDGYRRSHWHPPGTVLSGGASLSAFVKLGREKGYRLVGCQSYGFNVFFLRSGVGEDIFPETSPADCFGHPRVIDGIMNRLPEAAKKKWIQVQGLLVLRR